MAKVIRCHCGFFGRSASSSREPTGRPARLPRVLIVCAVALMLTAAVARGRGRAEPGSRAAHTGQFVGRISDLQAYVAIVTAHGRVLAYVCDGNGHAIHEYAWFQGRGSASFTLTSTGGTGAHRERLTGTRHGVGFTGSFTDAAGKVFAYRAVPARGRAGLFRAVGTVHSTQITVGWIALADGRERGGSLGKGSFTPMPIPTPRISDGGIVSIGGGTLLVHRVTSVAGTAGSGAG
jgi:hypothetical protein